MGESSSLEKYMAAARWHSHRPRSLATSSYQPIRRHAAGAPPRACSPPAAGTRAPTHRRAKVGSLGIGGEGGAVPAASSSRQGGEGNGGDLGA